MLRAPKRGSGTRKLAKESIRSVHDQVSRSGLAEFLAELCATGAPNPPVCSSLLH